MRKKNNVQKNTFIIELQLNQSKLSVQEKTEFKAALKDTSFDKIQISGELKVEAAKLLSRIIWHHDKLFNFFKGAANHTKAVIAYLYAPFIWGVPSPEGLALKHIAIEKCSIDPEAIDILTTAISDRVFSKTTLSLKNCKINDELFERLAKKRFRGLEALTLSSNLIGDQAIPRLCEILKKQKHKDLQHLDMQNNLITEVGAKQIDSMLAENTKILTLNLSENQISCEIQRKIDAHLADNKKIQAYRAAVKKNILDLSVLDIEHIDDTLIRRLAKFFKEYNCQVKKVVLPDGLELSEDQKNILATALLQNSSVTDILPNRVGQTVFKPEHPMSKMLKFNRKIKDIMGNSSIENIWLKRMVLYMFATALATSLFSSLLSTAGLTTLSTLFSSAVMPFGIIGGFFLFAGNLIYNMNFEKKLSALKNNQKWQESDYEAAAKGLSCSNSYIPWFSLESYKPAAYLIHRLAEDKQLDLLPDDVKNKLSI